MTLLTLWQSRSTLAELRDRKDLGLVVSWRLSTLLLGLADLGQRHDDLITSLAPVDGNGNVQLMAGSDEMAEFSRQFEELLQEAMPDFKPIELSRLEKANLSPGQFANLKWLIIEDED